MAAVKGISVKLSAEAIRDFLLKYDGKVKQADLIDYFRDELTNVSTKVRARQEFKDILQLITAAKTENGEKYILLTKNNQEHFHSTSLIARKVNRSISARKEVCKSKYDYEEHLKAPFASDSAYSHDHDCNSLHNSPLLTVRRKISVSESLVGVKNTSIVSLLRDALTSKIASSMDSLDSEDLEDDMRLGEVEIHPEDKEWMLACSNGKIDDMKKLLVKFPYLLGYRDFILGYNALHWAAKLGRTDIIDFISSNGIEIDTKSHGGSTPLHVAAMGGKDDVIRQLLELGANIHSRDYSGKKPKDIVKGSVSDGVQRKLGRSLVIDSSTVLHTGVISTIQVQRNKKTRRSFSTTSDGENSPLATPDLVRRHLKSTNAQRTLSFLKMKKKRESKLTADDIMHSPMAERPLSTLVVQNDNKDSCQERPLSDPFSNHFTFKL